MLWHDWLLAVTHMGNSVLLLSSALVLGLWLVGYGMGSGAWRHGVEWSAVLGTAVVVVFASKVAFIGWGIGIARWDFTGISGHAMLSMAVLPVVAAVMTLRSPWPIRMAAVGLCFVLATAVGVTRIELRTHSWSEVWAGWGLGLAVAVLSILRLRPLRMRQWSVWPLLAGNVLLLWATAPKGGKGPETHGLVVDIALWMSGRTEPFTRAMLHAHVN